MNKETAVETLKLFGEKADRLKYSNFVKNASKDSGVNLKAGVGKATVVTRSGPDQENVDAFVLTFRYFIQDNEMISLRNVEHVFHSQFAEPNEKSEYDKVRHHINSFLDGNSMFNLGDSITRRQLMETFIYGGLSHANKQKKKLYDLWMESPILAPFMENEFVVILFEILRVIVYIQNLSNQIFKRLKT
jgi:hypothetical protein